MIVDRNSSSKPTPFFKKGSQLPGFSTGKAVTATHPRGETSPSQHFVVFTSDVERCTDPWFWGVGELPLGYGIIGDINMGVS